MKYEYDVVLCILFYAKSLPCSIIFFHEQGWLGKGEIVEGSTGQNVGKWMCLRCMNGLVIGRWWSKAAFSMFKSTLAIQGLKTIKFCFQTNCAFKWLIPRQMKILCYWGTIWHIYRSGLSGPQKLGFGLN